MSWEIGRKEVVSGDTATFDFSGDVGLALYGISRFDINFATSASGGNLGGSAISGFGVKLTRENAGEDSRRQVKVKAEVSGTPLSSAKVWITVIAWVGGESSTLYVVSGEELATGQMSRPEAVVSLPEFSAAVLSGFKLDFDSGSHNVSGVGASAGISASLTAPGSAYVTGAATLTGKGASNCTVSPSGLVLGSAQEKAWFGMVTDASTYTVTDTNWGTTKLRVDTGSGVPLQHTAVLLQSFFGRFSATSLGPTPLSSVTMGAGEPAAVSAEPGVFEFDSTRWLADCTTIVNTGKAIWTEAQTYSAVYVWAALG
ncbi:hypothetical protein [Corallococcus aberystwythensis]|uniref:Uncharacterized protein n=1 Tax=Corallococcus aberystwythensis TaxID=2316722 RepID=A0A3A8R343_9BACT|nr:hypothetical protein [Corallococcus aberystwythensis]RKH74481.1 hypothetical protein D7W81_01585 [Corallococcus aberystwythensis]